MYTSVNIHSPFLANGGMLFLNSESLSALKIMLSPFKGRPAGRVGIVVKMKESVLAFPAE
jgi:hypothetical protein